MLLHKRDYELELSRMYRKQYLDSLLGEKIDSVIGSKFWKYPKAESVLANGNKIYTFVESETQHVNATTYHNRLGNSVVSTTYGGYDAEYRCSTTFEVLQGFIIRYVEEGNWCVNYGSVTRI